MSAHLQGDQAACVWPFGLLDYGFATLKFDRFLSLDCARVESVGAQGSNFAIWQPWFHPFWLTGTPATPTTSGWWRVT